MWIDPDVSNLSRDSCASNQDFGGFAKWELLLLADVFQGIHQLYSQICKQSDCILSIDAFDFKILKAAIR